MRACPRRCASLTPAISPMVDGPERHIRVVVAQRWERPRLVLPYFLLNPQSMLLDQAHQGETVRQAEGTPGPFD